MSDRNSTEYAEQLARLQARPLPAWFSEAKLGIFVHWTPSTIPAFAPLGPDPFALAAEHGWDHALANTPYAEWYENSLGIPDSPVQKFHMRTYGDKPYGEFVEQFRNAARSADIDRWADLFAFAGARYAVLVTKHHDGALLWPSNTPNPHRPRWGLDRDVVGDFASSVRSRGMRFGAYYSGGLDWTFIGPSTGHTITSFQTMISAIPQDATYAEYADTHWRELVERYEPEVLWNDIGYPKLGNMHDLFEWYYRRIPTGVVNDRFDFGGVAKGKAHADFVTPEYSGRAEIDLRPWETTRGLGTSFGYNALATDDDLIQPNDLVRLFIDTVANGGNLLLNVGPNADGEIPWNQALRLYALGDWLQVNSEAITGTSPWVRSQGTAASGAGTGADVTHDVRFTRGGDDLYAIVLGRPGSPTLTISLPEVMTPGDVTLLGRRGTLMHQRSGDGSLTVTLPTRPADAVAFTIKVSGAARTRHLRLT
jgi:alpha-L-fucosidase